MTHHGLTVPSCFCDMRPVLRCFDGFDDVGRKTGKPLALAAAATGSSNGKASSQASSNGSSQTSNGAPLAPGASQAAKPSSKRKLGLFEQREYKVKPGVCH